MVDRIEIIDTGMRRMLHIMTKMIHYMTVIDDVLTEIENEIIMADTAMIDIINRRIMTVK